MKGVQIELFRKKVKVPEKNMRGSWKIQKSNQIAQMLVNIFFSKGQNFSLSGATSASGF